MAFSRPLRPQPVSALVCLLLFAALSVVCFALGAVYIGIFGVVGAIVVPPNVYFGGAWNDSPLDVFERIAEFRRHGFETGASK